MTSLDEIINDSRDALEVKRAVCVKMALSGMPTVQITEMLNVTPQYVSKWRVRYEQQGAGSLVAGYRGSESYLTGEHRAEILSWIKTQETISVQAVRDYVEEQYGVVYQSKQSYYDLLQAAGLSYHKSEKRNPKRDEAQVLERRGRD
ncbi:MAG: transposase [Pyrinomonadaceae bacterium]|nr:transposase [Pyrinomonadaceae bacterium]